MPTSVEQLGIEVIKSMCENDIGALSALVAPDCRWHLPNSVVRAGLETELIGRQAIIDMVVRSHERNYPTLDMEVHEAFSQGDRAVVLCSLSCTTLSGAEYRNTYAYIFRFDNGLLVVGWELTDTAYSFEANEIR